MALHADNQIRLRTKLDDHKWKYMIIEASQQYKPPQTRRPDAVLLDLKREWKFSFAGLRNLVAALCERGPSHLTTLRYNSDPARRRF